MSEIYLNLPAGAIQKGSLHDDYEIEDLDQEILEIDLPIGLTIDVGWYPQFDRDGAFQIVVYRQFWENREWGRAHAKTPAAASRLVEAVAEYFCRPRIQTVSDSDAEYTTSDLTSNRALAYA